MAQTQKPTQKLYAACAKAAKGDTHDSWVAICLEQGDMSTFTEATNAASVECTVSGLSRIAATVTLATAAVADDQVVADMEFTAGAGATVTGFEVMSATTAGNMMMWCAFAASQALETNDKIKTTGRCQIKLGS